MRFVRTLIPVVFLLAPFACHSGDDAPDNDPFDTYQDCYNEHHMTEGFDTQCAIEICCIDHPIGSQPMNVVCGSDAATCDAYVGSNLTDANDPTLGSDITTACGFYFVDSGRGSGTGGKCSG
ncbi:MAG TPA: hypothetical protein VH143_09220 [Kofleriaceae bacterium]|jgi:hypothetical protein|nr:hypothetical protein [Kofleriaceae bacterium]